MDKSEMLNAIAEALELPVDRITESTTIEDVEEWDSLGWLNIIAMLDEKYSLQVEARQLVKHESAGALVEYLMSRLA